MIEDPLSHGLWAQTAPPPPATEQLRHEIDADVGIVGAGFTGLSAALHLAEGGARVAVLEAADIGFGGSGRNVGLVNAGLWIMPEDVRAILGERHGERLLETLSEAPGLVFELIRKHRIECEAARHGTLHCAVGPAGVADIERRAAQWQARGAPVRLLGRDAAANLVGSTAYEGALLDERAGTIQPLAYARGLARAAMAAGAAVHTGSPVLTAEPLGGGWRLGTAAGSVKAAHVIVATNAYTRAGALPWSGIAGELVPLPYFQFATRPLGHNLKQSILPGRQGAWDTKDILSSFRLDQAGRLVFGSIGALRGTGTAVHRAWARRAIRRIFPQLGPLEFEAAWYGRIGMTRDATPRLHEFAPNMIGFAGYNGRGIAPGTAFGRLLAEHISGRLSADDLPLAKTEVAAEPLRRLKAAYYEVGAQVAHVAGDRL